MAGSGTAHDDGAEAADLPAALVAVIVTWYGICAHNPVIQVPEFDPATVTVFAAGAGHTVVVDPARGVAVNVYPLTWSAGSFGSHAASTANPSPDAEVITGAAGTVPARADTTPDAAGAADAEGS